MSTNAEPKTILGRQLACTVCGHTSFHERSAQLNTAGMSFLNLDFLNKTATCYICEQCRHILWFNQ